MDAQKYKKLFLVEAEEKIAALNTALLGLEKEPGSSAFANDAMRASHTLKSSSAAMDFMGISHLAHAMENFFEQVRFGKQSLTSQEIEILFESADLLSASIDAIKKGGNEIETKSLIEKILNLKSKILNLKSNKSETINQKAEIIAPIESIKVDVAVIDKLMSLTEELLVEKMRLSEIVRHAKENPEALISRAEIESSSESFERLISELQLNVTQARMVPLGQIFERFPRMVRDLSHNQNKEVDFQITGQDIELDRTIIDRLGEPLIHLLRNAVDHGISARGGSVLGGEKLKGKIILSAERLRDNVTITVCNEGDSIDWQKVAEVAFARGIIDKTKRDMYLKEIAIKHENTKTQKHKNNETMKQENNQITNYQLQTEIESLLYHVSTKDKVTEISGRGVGLGIVKSVIESLGGTVRVESNVDNTKFVLSLPLTIAIIQALLVRVANQTFALPFAQIDRSVRVSKQNIKKAFDQEVAVVEGQDIPMVRLDKFFKIEKKRLGLFLDEEEIEKRISQTEDELMVITKKENFIIAGVMIDELISEQDIVVKPFKGMLRQTKGFAGITLLGDGKPALILDVETLI